MTNVETFADSSSLAAAAAESFAALAKKTIARSGRFNVALAGGSTPKAAYSLLAKPKYQQSVDWAAVHFFWGDERCVAPDHPDSNYRMVREALLDKVPVPDSNVHRIQCELSPELAATNYEQVLRQQLSVTSSPGFDLVLLGMGSDGHTASLFPGLPAIEEKNRWVVAHFVDSLDTWRVSLTPVAINAASNVIFLVSGPGKAPMLGQVLSGPYHPMQTPSQIVRPSDGVLTWMVDQAAAALL